MKILVIGINGQVGNALMQQLSEHNLIGLTREKCNLTKSNKIKQIIDYHHPDLIINAAAYTKVDLAEDEPDLAFQINSEAPKVMAEKANEYKIPFIHFSTDYVFDGMKKGAYIENDQTNPLGIYGQSKLAGEQAVQEIGGQYYIFRTSWVYSNIGKNFFLTIKELINEHDEIKVISDQIGVPTSNKFIAKEIKKIITRLDPSNIGIYNLVPDGFCSWYEFAQKIIIKINPNYNFEMIYPILTKDYSSKARRPNNGVLDNSQIKKIFMLEFDHWELVLDRL